MGLTATIGSSQIILDGSMSIQDQIDQTTQFSITVVDTTGTASFQKGNPVSIDDSILGNLFVGFVNQPNCALLYPSNQKLWTLACVDETYLINKRTSNKIYNDQYAGIIAVDQVRLYGVVEGVTVAAALRWDELETDWSAGTLTNTVAATNATNGNEGGGDLELALAGTAYTYSGSVSSETWNAIAFTAYASSGYTAPICVRQIWTGSQALVTNDTFSYNVWIASDSPAIIASCDFVCSDGTTLSSTTAVDTLGLSAKATTDLSGLANDQWFTRAFLIPSALNGKTLKSVNLVLAGVTAGTYRAWFSDIFYVVASGPTIVNLFGPTDTLTTNNQLSRVGYTQISAGQVTALDSARQQPVTTIGAVSAPVIVQSSQIAWDAVVPDGCEVVVETSIDGQASWQVATSGSAIPNLAAGLKTSNLDLNYRVTLQAAKDPTVTSIGLTLLTMLINPAYAATKTDVFKAYASSNAPAATAFNAAGTTLTHTALDGFGNLELNGFQNDWSDGSTTGQTLFSSSTASQSAVTQRLNLTAAASNDVRARIDPAGQWQNFTTEVDITVPTSATSTVGMNYRGTNFQNAANSFAYSIEVGQSTFKFGRGNNSSSGAGAFTQIATATVSLVAGSVHRLKIVVSGTSHIFFLDGIQLISQTDSTYSAAGYISLRFFNNSGGTLTTTFDNFGVVEALSGTWQSAAVSIASAATYGTSMVIWDIDGIPDVTCAITVQASVDGGSTFQSVANGGAISGLTAGQSLTSKTVILKVTLTASNAPIVPILNGISLWVQGQYSASGTRVAPSLSLSPVGRAATAIVAWNALVPPRTTQVVETSLDAGSTWQSMAASGDAISGINTQPDPVEDVFAVNSSSAYTQSNFASGANGTWTWDTTNSRLSGSGGTNGTLVNSTALTAADNQVMADFDRADGSGLIANYASASAMYFVQIWDDSASGNQNALKLFRRSSGSNTQLGSTTTIAFPRGTYKRFILDIQAGALTVSMDNVTVLTVTDGSPLSAGKSGLLLNSLLRCYTLRIQQYGDNVSSKSLLTRLTLTSTDPTATPQILDMQAFVSSPSIGLGKLESQKDYRRKYVSANIDDLNKDSNFWWYMRQAELIFQPRNASPAPWVLSSANWQELANQKIGDIQVANLGLSSSGDLYRNRQIMQNATATASYVEIKSGDGQSQSWNVTNPLAAPPIAITLNGIAKTFGLQGVDSGKDFYYQLGSTTITQDSGGAILTAADSLVISYVGSFLQDVVRDNTAIAGTITQSAMAAIDGTSGINEAVQDATGLTVDQATAQADQYLERYGNIGRTLTFVTLRPGLKPGQQLSAILPELNIVNAQMLITGVTVTANAAAVAGGILYYFSVTATEGPNLGNWAKLFANVMRGD